MVWPVNQQANTSNIDSAVKSPQLARQDLFNALVLLNQVIASANGSSGAVITNTFNKINPQQLPNNIAMLGNISLQPDTGWVNIQSVLNISPQTTEQLEASALTPELGDVVIVSDADAGSPAVCFYDGTDWRKLPFSTLSVL
jgi:hypothetical protein